MLLAIGIDLGTTFSCIAYIDAQGNAKILENREGERVTPSVVNFDEKGNPVVGTTAKQLSVTQPQNTVQYVKRSIGEKNWKFLTDDGKGFSAEEISAIILRRLKEDAEAVLNESIRDAVITVPAYFDDAQRKATQDAGHIAGLNVLKIINEPTAAALAYGCGKEEEDEVIAVYDLGGGTFDVTVIRINRNSISVLATGGDRNLGGFDWDNQLMLHLNEEFLKACELDLLANTENGEAYLREKAESAKKALTLRESTTVSLAIEGKRCKVEINRSMFDEITESLTKRTIGIMRDVLHAAAKFSEDKYPSFVELIQSLSLKKILLVGGSTRMPAIRKVLESETGITPSIELNPDEVVALGAATQAALIIMQNEKDGEKKGIPTVSHTVIQDVNSHGLGVIAARGDKNEEYNAIIMPKNTPIPSKASEVFYTVQENQRALKVQVTEGDDEEKNMVKVIGEAEMIINPHPKQSPVEVLFEYDGNGIVHVSVKDLVENKDLGEMIINRESNLTEGQISAMKKRLQSISVD